MDSGSGIVTRVYCLIHNINKNATFYVQRVSEGDCGERGVRGGGEPRDTGPLPHQTPQQLQGKLAD